MLVVISGVPGTGKSEISKELSRILNAKLIELKSIAVKRNLIGKIITRFEEDDMLKIREINIRTLTRSLVEKNYAEHEGKEFYNRLIEFITSGPVVAMVIEGENAIFRVRELVGATDPSKAEPGTIRGDFKEVPVKSITENMIHASDSEASAKRELSLFF